MQMAHSFRESLGVLTIIVYKLPDEPSGIMCCCSRGSRLLGGELQRPSHMPSGIEQQPAFEPRRVAMVAQNPFRTEADLMLTAHFAAIIMRITDAAIEYI